MNYVRPPFEPTAAVSCYNSFLSRSVLDRSSPISRKPNSMSPLDHQFRSSSKFDPDDDEVLKLMKGSQIDPGLVDGSPNISFNSAFIPPNRDVFHSTPTSVPLPVNLNAMQHFAANLLTSPTHQSFPFHAAFNPSGSPPSKGLSNFHHQGGMINPSPNAFSSLSGLNCANPPNADHIFGPYGESNQRNISRPYMPLSPCPTLEGGLSSVELDFPSLDSRHHQRNSSSIQRTSSPVSANINVACSPSNLPKNNFENVKISSTDFRSRLELPDVARRTAASSSANQSSTSAQSNDFDPYGMASLKQFLQDSGNHENAQYTINTDLTTLGLNINGMESLFPTFLSPFSEYAARPHEIECAVPHEYLVFSLIKERLSSIQLDLYQDDLLFYLFYNFCGDILQMLAALELFNRDWRFHKEEKIWICRIPGKEPSNKTQTHECGTYYVFDVVSWRKVTRDMRIDYDKLDEKSVLPANFERNKATLEGKRRRAVDSW